MLNRIALALALLMLSVPAFATPPAMDFSGVLGGLSVAAVITGIIAAGALKASPNFAKWATNKLANFFGR